MAQVREILAGRYDLLDVLGRGGMGVVYRARDRVLDRVVAIKVLPAERAEDPVFVARFEREARAAAALNHPGIVSVFDSGRDADTRFIVMEYVPGESLAQLLRERGPLPPRDAVAIATQIASALAAAHAAGIVHRDVKPANVMADDQLHVKVLDFGIARAIAATSLTHTSLVLGSAPYMSPEVTRGETADERSDIYSLGCVLYEMLTGGPPFSGELGAAIMHQHNSARPRRPRSLAPGTPAALDALVMRMLAKRASERPQQAKALVDSLPASLRGRASRTVARPVAPSAPTEQTRILRRARRSQSRGRLLALGVVALLLAGVAIAGLGSSSPRPHRSASRTAAKTAARRPAKVHGVRSRPAAAVRTTPTVPSTPTVASPPTVASAAGALTTLITQDLQAGTIDQQAAQPIQGGLQDILNSYDGGKIIDAQHKLSDLTTHISQLSAHGDVNPSALPAINAAIGALGTALGSGAAAAATPRGPAAGPGKDAGPPGHQHPHPGKGGGGD